jgi:ethanolamine permease
MTQKRSTGFVRYQKVGSDYLHQRQLRKVVSWELLWFLGVGAVISGDFSGWNFGLAAGGFWGLAIASTLMAIMYLCMVYSIAELSSALPHAGGFYSFVRYAFGPFAGFICGITLAIEYVLTPAVIVYFISTYLNTLLPSIPIPFWWFFFYVVFVTINIRGVELTMKVGLLITVVAIIVLCIFYFGAVSNPGAFSSARLFNLPPDPGQSANWLPKGWGGVFKAFPYAIWFYLAIEQLPLASEEAKDIRDIPKALTFGIYTLLALSIFTLFINSGVGGGVLDMGKSSAPFADGLKSVFGTGPLTVILTILATSGLIASFHTVIYAYGRVLFSLSRAGYLPEWISVTSSKKIPARALILGGIIGFACTAAIQISGQTGAVGAALLNMAVFGAVISYALAMLSYIKLKRDYPNLPRPYTSPLGIWGAGLGIALALSALFTCFADPAYQPGVWGVALFLAVGIAYFLFFRSNKLVPQAPEEQAALMATVSK